MLNQIKILDVYLEAEYFNPVCNATIPGAWVAHLSNGVTQSFAWPEEHETTASAKRAACEFLGVAK